MFQTYFLSAGCAKRCNTAVKYKDYLIYASGINICIADLFIVKNMILRQNLAEITYLNVYDNCLYACDILGNLECYKLTITNKELIFEQTFSKNLEIPIYSLTGRESLLIAAQLKKLVVLQDNKQDFCEFNEIISCVEFLDDTGMYFLVSLHTGDVEIYELKDMKISIIAKHKCHNDNITSIKVQRIEENLFFCSTSTDNTAKVYKINHKCVTSPSDTGTNYKRSVFELQTTLFGHKDHVYGCTWTNTNDIVTCSADNTIIFWRYVSGQWHLSQRLGGFKEKNQMFYNVVSVQNCILAQSNSGGFYKYNDFMLEKYLTGSTNAIKSIDCYNDLVLTTSLDFTTRIYSILLRQEIGRPQIHGYPMQIAKFLRNNTYNFVSGGQETIMRVFKPTLLFLQNYWNLIDKYERNLQNQIELNIEESKENILTKIKGIKTQIESQIHADMPKLAKLSELNLSHDVSYENIDVLIEEGNNERNLATSFLFQEVKKVYGHFFDISDIAVSENTIISCNKSSSKKYAPIFVWSKKFEKIETVEAHDLGIQKLRYSVDQKYAVACSRDQKVSLYKVTNNTLQNIFVLKYHSRCVNDVDISYDNLFISSVSKDKTLKIHTLQDGRQAYSYDHDCELTSVKFSRNSHNLYVGTKNGEILVFTCNTDEFYIKNKFLAHSKSVTNIDFDQKEEYMITGGADNLLRIFDLMPSNNDK